MPILAGFPVVDTVEQVADPFLDSRTLAFRSLDGTDLLPFTGDEFIAMWGTRGLDMLPRTLIEGQVQGMDGSQIDDVQIGSRPVLLPMFCGSNSGHLPYLNNRARMRQFFNHRGVNLREHDGTFDLVARSVMGERTLRCIYRDGMAGDWEQDSSGSYWEKFVLDLLAPRAYWYGPRWSTPPIYKPQPAAWFGDFPPELSSSRALGSGIPVLIDGDVETWVRIDLVGPADWVLIEADGVEVYIPDGLADGETAVVDLNPRVDPDRSALFDGLDGWERIAPTFRRAPLQPGVQSITINLPGASASTFAQVSGDTLFESPW